MDSQDRQKLLETIENLNSALESERFENAMLRRILFTQYEKQPRPMNRLQWPLPERAIILFEVLPDSFGLEDVLAMGERLGMAESEAAEHVRSFFQEGMLSESEEGGTFTKSGFRPYL